MMGPMGAPALFFGHIKKDRHDCWVMGDSVFFLMVIC